MIYIIAATIFAIFYKEIAATKTVTQAKTLATLIAATAAPTTATIAAMHYTGLIDFTETFNNLGGWIPDKQTATNHPLNTFIESFKTAYNNS